MSLPEADRHFLAERELPHQVLDDSNMTCIVFLGWPLPPGLSVREVDLLVRLAAGYPDVAPDCWWVTPAVSREDGSVIPATDLPQEFLGRTWQRWSRHFPGNWQSGIDGLQSLLVRIRAEFDLAASGQAA
jgi:hypothetical protein